MFDVSPVTFPAYHATDVGVMAFEAYKAEVRAKAEEAENSAFEDKRAADRARLRHLQNKFKIGGKYQA